MHGTHDPRIDEPVLAPGAARRITQIDSHRPQGVLGPVHMYAYGYDLVSRSNNATADSTNPDITTVDTTTIEATVGFSDGRRLLSLTITPPIPGLESLIGLSVSSGFRTALDLAWPDGAA